jgi:hypothetical protein
MPPGDMTVGSTPTTEKLPVGVTQGLANPSPSNTAGRTGAHPFDPQLIAK